MHILVPVHPEWAEWIIKRKAFYNEKALHISEGPFHLQDLKTSGY